MKKTLRHIVLSASLILGAGFLEAGFISPAFAQEGDVVEKVYPTFVLVYRDNNRWVHQIDKKPLDDLSRYAKREGIMSFDVILPDRHESNVYIERLLVLSRILKSRLRKESIVFRQELGTTSPNTISVTPSDVGTTTE